MTNYEFLTKYYHLQKDVMLDKLEETEYGTISFCQFDPHEFWNNALINTNVTPVQLTFFEEKLKQLERKPAVYFENKPELSSLKTLLTANEYQQMAEDSWMFHSGENIDTSRFNQVKIVETKEDLQVFLNVFDRCYQKDDPLNPYGELGEYLKVTEAAWHKFVGTDRLLYIMAYQGQQPVAVATLNNCEGIGYISNVGSLRSVRGEGFGKLATMYCVNESIEASNELHCLATEEGTYPNEFYKRIGFRTKFTALCYSKPQ